MNDGIVDYMLYRFFCPSNEEYKLTGIAARMYNDSYALHMNEREWWYEFF